MRTRGDDDFVPSGLEGVNKSIKHNFCCQLETVLLNLEKQEEDDSDENLINVSQVFQRLCVAGWVLLFQMLHIVVLNCPENAEILK